MGVSFMPNSASDQRLGRADATRHYIAFTVYILVAQVVLVPHVRATPATVPFFNLAAFFSSKTSGYNLCETREYLLPVRTCLTNFKILIIISSHHEGLTRFWTGHS